MSENTLRPRSARRKNRIRPSAILVLRRKYTDFRFQQYLTTQHLRNAEKRRTVLSHATYAPLHWSDNYHRPLQWIWCFLPRIPLIPSDANILFEFKRLQFPVRVCFAKSISAKAWQWLVSIYKHPVFHMGSTMLGAHGLARQGIFSFVHLVVRLGMLFTKKLFRTCHYIPAQNKHMNHLYIIVILHISVLCLTVFFENNTSYNPIAHACLELSDDMLL